MVFRYHCPRAGARACTAVSRVLSHCTFADVSDHAPLARNIFTPRPEPFDPFPSNLGGMLPHCPCQSDLHLLAACKRPHQPSIAKAACISIPGRLKKSWSAVLRKTRLSGTRLPVICMQFSRDPDSARPVQTHSRAAPANSFFQERKETLIPRWDHTPSAPTHARFFPLNLTVWPPCR